MDDLYNDLEDSSTPFRTSSQAAASSSFGDAPSGASSSSTQSSAVALANENMILKRNISILFRTAKAELKRKDTEIMRLQDIINRMMIQQQQFQTK